MKYLFIILLFVSCSAEWHLKQAVKKNPKYGQKETISVPYYKDTTIYKTIYISGDSSMQSTKLIVDSLNKVFNDSFTTVYQLVNKLGKIKTTVVRKPYYIRDTTYIEIKDTIRVETNKQINVEDKTPTWIWVLILIFIILFLLLLNNLVRK